MNQEIPQFGLRDSNAEYILRPGGYAIIVNRTSGAIAVVETPKGVFLLGGGCEADESPADAAVRETREETGLHVEITDELCAADEFLFSADEQVHYQKRCTFFVVQGCPDQTETPKPVEADHVLKWMPPQAACKQLTFESQRWALNRWITGQTPAAAIRNAKSSVPRLSDPAS